MSQNQKSSIGVKYDSGKVNPTVLLVVGQALESVVRVLVFGAKKYGVNNWISVPNAESRYYDAALRHLLADAAGDEDDPESGEPHLAHAACSLMFISDLQIFRSNCEREERAGSTAARHRQRPHTQLDYVLGGMSLLPPLAILDLSRALGGVEDYESAPLHRSSALHYTWQSAKDRSVVHDGIRDSTVAAMWTLSALEDRIVERKMRVSAVGLSG